MSRISRILLISVQLAIALPLLWWGLFPRLGPVEWATFILLAGVLSSYVAPLFAAADAWWYFRRTPRPGGRGGAPALLMAVVWGAIAVMGWTGIAITPLRSQFAEAPARAAAVLHCMPTRARWTARGAEITCRKTVRSGEREIARVLVSNGPFPWSPWRIDPAEPQMAPPQSGRAGRDL